MLRWLGAFLFTQAVEVPIYGYALKGRLHIAFLASLITHPFVWFGFPYLQRGLAISYPVTVLLAELFAIGTEALLLWRCGLRRAAWWALAANVASAGLGLTSRHFFGWP